MCCISRSRNNWGFGKANDVLVFSCQWLIFIVVIVVVMLNADVTVRYNVANDGKWQRFQEFLFFLWNETNHQKLLRKKTWKFWHTWMSWTETSFRHYSIHVRLTSNSCVANNGMCGRFYMWKLCTKLAFLHDDIDPKQTIDDWFFLVECWKFLYHITKAATFIIQTSK